MASFLIPYDKFIVIWQIEINILFPTPLQKRMIIKKFFKYGMMPLIQNVGKGGWFFFSLKLKM